MKEIPSSSSSSSSSFFFFLLTTTLLHLLLFSQHLLPVTSYDSSQFLENYPTPFTAHNRIMGLILAYNHYHIDPMMLILNEYVSMCEAGWSPTMVIFTTMTWEPKLLRYYRQKSYCYRTQSSIDIRISQHDPSINIALGAQHRPYLAKEIQNYDVFVYHEDDILFKLSHLSGYLYETKRLHELLPEDGLRNHCIGFQRYRRIYHGNDIHTPFGENDIFEQELLEEMPNFVPTCIKEQPYLRVDGNIHQAMWVLTKQQIVMLQEKCSFFNQSSPSREFMSSFSLFDHKPYHCGLTKLLPAERLVTFSILHYFQQKHISWTSVFFADENIRAGYHYSASPRTPMATPDCWKKIVEDAKTEQEPSSSSSSSSASSSSTTTTPHHYYLRN